MTAQQRIDAIEALIHQDVGRNITRLLTATRGGLWQAASALAAAPAPRIGLLTGFYVPLGSPPAAETDGPAGAALFARFLSRIGVPCRLLTDAPCVSACRAALVGAGLADVPVDAVAVDGPLDATTDAWRQDGVNWVIAIERCGRSADGAPRNMRGQDVSAYAAPLDEVFAAGPWQTIGIGDGGNELGMGSLPAGLIEAHIAFGAAIACVTPATHLVMAGVSHWGVYGLIAALGVLRPDWRSAMLDCLEPQTDQAIMEALVSQGPAVDGVSLRQGLTIDSLDLAEHHRKLTAIRAIALHPSLGERSPQRGG
jgi:D-glutamate cyclase